MMKDTEKIIKMLVINYHTTYCHNLVHSNLYFFKSPTYLIKWFHNTWSKCSQFLNLSTMWLYGIWNSIKTFTDTSCCSLTHYFSKIPFNNIFLSLLIICLLILLSIFHMYSTSHFSLITISQRKWKTVHLHLALTCASKRVNLSDGDYMSQHVTQPLWIQEV
jgi:hypothetical protein